MPEGGGPTTQSGTYFQNTVAAWFMARMLHDTSDGQSENRVIRVRCVGGCPGPINSAGT